MIGAEGCPWFALRPTPAFAHSVCSLLPHGLLPPRTAVNYLSVMVLIGLVEAFPDALIHVPFIDSMDMLFDDTRNQSRRMYGKVS